MDRLMVGKTGAASTPPTLALLPTATQHNPNKLYEHSDPKYFLPASGYMARCRHARNFPGVSDPGRNGAWTLFARRGSGYRVRRRASHVAPCSATVPAATASSEQRLQSPP